MTLSLIQWLAIIFSLFAWSRAILRFKEGEIKWNELLFWSVTWITLIAITILPGITQFFSDLFGIGRGVDFVVIVSIIVLFYLMFRLYVKIDSLENEITKVVRENALRKKK